MGRPLPVGRNLAAELEDDADDDDDNGEEGVAPGDRPPLIPRATRNADTPSANRVLARLAKKCGPKLVEDTVLLLTAMGFRCNGRPNSLILGDWSLSRAGAELLKWKRRLRSAFGLERHVGSRQMIARTAEFSRHDSDPSRVPLSKSPETKKGKKEVFRATKGTPYYEDSHMQTPKTLKGRSARYTEFYDAADEAELGGGDSDDDQDYRDNAEDSAKDVIRRLSLDDAERDRGHYLEVRSHASLDKIAEFEGKRYRSDDSLQWLKRFIYEMKGTRMPQDSWCEPFSLCLGRAAKSCRPALDITQLGEKRTSQYAISSSGSMDMPGQRRYNMGRVAQTLPTTWSTSYSIVEMMTLWTCCTLCVWMILSELKKSSTRKYSERRRSDSATGWVVVEAETTAQSSHSGAPKQLDQTKAGRVNAEMTAEMTGVSTSETTGELDERTDAIAESPWRKSLATITLTLGSPTRKVVAGTLAKTRLEPKGTRLGNSRTQLATGIQSTRRQIAVAELVDQATARITMDAGVILENDPSTGHAGGGQGHSVHFCRKRCKFYQQVHDVGRCELFQRYERLANFVTQNVDKSKLPTDLQDLYTPSNLNSAARQH
ncbi:unnamed protein product [Phytophthora fragariaefolia]|uniref:Unnamed protein product n=1 Tax=Phytophthora fragariaefolia TaxID=1490495 RepID=A0A9W6YAD2_9STRA|nr:unnamed protein product [Phytophthora fragariaefolia]